MRGHFISVKKKEKKKKRSRVEDSDDSSTDEEEEKYQNSTMKKRARRVEEHVDSTTNEDEKIDEYQSVLRQVLRYRDHRELTLGQKRVVEFVKKYYEIPEDFDKDKSFGPLSGSSPELRLVSAYAGRGVLKLKDGLKEEDVPIMCYVCGEIGHDAWDTC